MLRLKNRTELNLELVKINSIEERISDLLYALTSNRFDVKKVKYLDRSCDFKNWYFLSVDGFSEVGICLSELFTIDTFTKWLIVLFDMQTKLQSSNQKVFFKRNITPKWARDVMIVRYRIIGSINHKITTSFILICTPLLNRAF